MVVDDKSDEAIRLGSNYEVELMDEESQDRSKTTESEAKVVGKYEKLDWNVEGGVAKKVKKLETKQKTSSDLNYKSHHPT